MACPAQPLDQRSSHQYSDSGFIVSESSPDIARSVPKFTSVRDCVILLASRWLIQTVTAFGADVAHRSTEPGDRLLSRIESPYYS